MATSQTRVEQKSVKKVRLEIFRDMCITIQTNNAREFIFSKITPSSYTVKVEVFQSRKNGRISE